MTATVLTIETLDSVRESLPSDMGDEISQALSAGSESAIEYARMAEYNSEATHYAYLPNAGRGGVCPVGGQTDWTDCSSLDDLAERWANYEEQWVN